VPWRGSARWISTQSRPDAGLDVSGSDRTLNRLGTGYLDLLYIHRWDDDTELYGLLSVSTVSIARSRATVLENSDSNPYSTARSRYSHSANVVDSRLRRTYSRCIAAMASASDRPPASSSRTRASFQELGAVPASRRASIGAR